jgi:uncharacterized protein (TIGR02452 family)
MNKNNRLEIANKTIEIIESGIFNLENKKINLKDKIQESTINTFTISPDDFVKIKNNQIIENDFGVDIVVKNCSTIQAILEEKDDLKIGVLNFASAKNPGGGFLGGASAQEESLARSSSLYKSLTKDISMYNHNKNQSTFLYSDYMIYSPNVLFWFDDEGNCLENLLVADVITAPAPNKGAMLQHNRKEELNKIDLIFKNRIDNVLAIANQQKIDCLILGAWGCGVFRNEPKNVAEYFCDVIKSKYGKAFKKIVFAIYDTSEKKTNLKLFENVFNENRIKKI